MAHQLLTKPREVVFSSDLEDIQISVDGSFVDVEISGLGFTLLSERFYAYGNRVTIYEVGALMEAAMRDVDMAFGSFSVSLLDASGVVADSHIMHVIYCERVTYGVDRGQFLSENFLSTLAYRRVPPDDESSLYLFANAGEPLRASISLIFRDRRSGEDFAPVTYVINEDEIAGSQGIVRIDISLPNLLSRFSSERQLLALECEIVSVTVSVGQRSVTLFVDGELETRREIFVFRNIFNLPEKAVLPCTSKKKSEVERPTASIINKARFYNQKVTQTFEVETGPLTSDEADWIDQLFTSRSVCHVARYGNGGSELLMPVFVTDSECEVGDTDDKPNIVKFSWRYEDNRPLSRLSASPGIFTKEYQLPFS